MAIEKRTVSSAKGEITVYKITNSNGAWVELSTLGAGILSVNLPTEDGKTENVCLGYPDPTDYIADGPCMGKVPGRYANRLANGRVTIGGKEYELPVNNGPNHLHGGPEGFQNQIWKGEEVKGNTVRFTYFSADGEMGYPGNLTATAEYEWTDDNVLKLRLAAESDKETVVNLTNHAYWNLDGAYSGSVLQHLLKIPALKYYRTDETLIPQALDEVQGTPMDFRAPKPLGWEINADFDALKFGKGYDNCWLLDEWQEGKKNVAAVLIGPKKGRRLTVCTDQPGVQIYTGNWLAGSPKNHCGKSYKDYEGVAIECQGIPDAPNLRERHPSVFAPSQTLLPGKAYHREIDFAFT